MPAAQRSPFTLRVQEGGGWQVTLQIPVQHSVGELQLRPFPVQSWSTQWLVSSQSPRQQSPPVAQVAPTPPHGCAQW